MRSGSVIATPPGATIREQLVDRGMSQKEFAVRMDMSEKHISKLINGEVILTPETSVRLEMVLGIPAKFWNNLEAIYREKIIKAETESAMDADIEIAKSMPYSEMAKLGWIPEVRSSKDKVINLRQFFEVVNLTLLGDDRVTKRIACRRLAVTKKSDLALMAWAQEAKIKARDIETAPISISALNDKIPDIRQMTNMRAKDFFPKMRGELAQCGIALVLLPHLKGSYLQGATFVDGNKIVIGITARGKDADKFWFSLFHEIAHIVLGHIGQTEDNSNDDELAADAWSRETLIKTVEFEEFAKTKELTESSIKRFAKKQGIDPGIVVGRLQKEKIIDYTMYNNLKKKYEIA